MNHYSMLSQRWRLKKQKTMFTIHQIKEAHSRVKSGADFPAYIRELIQLGVTSYSTFVSDGHARYVGKDGYEVLSGAKYDILEIADTSNKHQFQKDLKAHQEGRTGYPAFCSDCARSGIEKWMVDMETMTCTYYDKEGNEIVQEDIPAS